MIKIVVKKFKKEEFLESMHMYQAKIRKQPGCLSYDLYQDSEEENTYRLVGEWKTPQAMKKHFQTHEFELLLGATKVLCQRFEMETAEVSSRGDFEWALLQKESLTIKQKANSFKKTKTMIKNKLTKSILVIVAMAMLVMPGVVFSQEVNPP